MSVWTEYAFTLSVCEVQISLSEYKRLKSHSKYSQCYLWPMRHSLCRIGKFINEYFSKLTWVFRSFLSFVFLLIIDNCITFLLTFRHLRKYRFNFRDMPRSVRKLQNFASLLRIFVKKTQKMVLNSQLTQNLQFWSGASEHSDQPVIFLGQVISWSKK